MLSNAKHGNKPWDLLLLAFIMFSLTVRSICVCTHTCVNVCVDVVEIESGGNG